MNSMLAWATFGFELMNYGSARTLDNQDVIWMRSDRASTLAFSTDGQLLASAGDGFSIHVRRAADGVLVRSIRDRGSIKTLAFSPDGQLLADGKTNGSLSNLALFEVATGTELQVLDGHESATRSVAFAPDGRLLASGGDDQTAKLWRISDGALHQTLQMDSPVHSVAFSPDGQLLAVGAAGSITLWRVSDGIHLCTLAPSFGDAACSVAFAPDGETIAAGSLCGGLRWWQVSDGALLQKIKLPGGDMSSAVASIAFSRDSDYVIVGNNSLMPEQGAVRFWRTADGTLAQRYAHPTGFPMSALAVCPLGAAFAYSRAKDGVVTVARSPF